MNNTRDELLSAIEQLTAELTDSTKWSWTRGTSEEDAANEVLSRMVQLGLIEGRQHPHTFGGTGFSTYRINGRLYGRTDGVDNELFDDARHTLKPEGERDD